MPAATKVRFYDERAAGEADQVTGAAVRALLHEPPNLRTASGPKTVVVVAAPAGAGKTYFIVSAAEAALAQAHGRPGTVLIGTPTNEQAYALLPALAQRLGVDIAFVHAKDKEMSNPPPGVHQVAASEAMAYPVVVGTLSKLGDPSALKELTPFRCLLVDEAYQANSELYFCVAGLADRHLLVGDPGQLAPFSTLDDPDRWKGLTEDPTQTAVDVIATNYPALCTYRLPITRRLPPSALPVARAFYPGHRFGTWTVPGARRLELSSGVGAGGAGPLEAGVDAALDLAAGSGLAYLRLPNTPVLVADPRTVEVVTATVQRLMGRSPRVADERTGGAPTALPPERVAVAVSHNDQKDHVRIALAERGLGQVRVDTANKLQGLEVDVLVAWHPLAGLPTPDGFHLDPGRLCVMLTRHRHALVVVGRVGDAGLLGDVPPASDAWLGVDDEPEVTGWFAHRAVFDCLRNSVIDLA